MKKFRLKEESLRPEDFKIKSYEWVNGKLNVKGDVDLGSLRLQRLPFEFGVVTGSFNCYNNNLTNLEGSPSEVGGDFACNNNKLTSLKGAPTKVRGYFNCYNNKNLAFDGVLEAGDIIIKGSFILKDTGVTFGFPNITARKIEI